MYQLIYDFLATHLFNGSALSSTTHQVLGVSMSMNEWLCHTTTIICICLIIAFLILFVRWMFRLVSGLFLLR